MNLAELKERLKALYNPDPTGTKRRSRIKSEHYSRIRASADRRDKEIDQAKKRHADEIETSDEDRDEQLDNLEIEVKEERHKKREFDHLLAELNQYTDKIKERRYITNDFAPNVVKTTFPSPRSTPNHSQASNPTTTSELKLSRSRFIGITPSSTLGDHAANVALSRSSQLGSTELSMGISFVVPPKIPKIPKEDTPLNKRKLLPMELPLAKKVCPGELTAQRPELFRIEDGPIGAQLIETAFIFVSAWDIPVKKKNIEYFRKMFGQFNFFPTIRADATGYFAIFDDIDGIGKAEACFDRFKSWKFRKAKMNMKLYKCGEEMKIGE